MPDMDGLEFVLNFRNHWPKPKIVGTSDGSGRGDYLDVVEYLEVDNTLKKPLNPWELLDAVSVQLKFNHRPSANNDEAGGHIGPSVWAHGGFSSRACKYFAIGARGVTQ